MQVLWRKQTGIENPILIVNITNKYTSHLKKTTMKNLLLIVTLFICVSHSSFAQTLFVPSGTAGIGTSSVTGKVGIGTGMSAPAGHLQVKGVGYFGNENANTASIISLGSSGGDYGSIGYGFKFTTTGDNHTYIATDYASRLRFHQGGFDFFTAPSGTVNSVVPFTNVMRITQNGNVGIGIGNQNPTARLDVSSNSSTTVLMHLNQTGTSGAQVELQRFSAPGGSSYFNVAAILAKTNGTNSAGSYLSINPIMTNGTGWAEGITIYAGGNVGVGTNTPGPFRLYANGNSRFGGAATIGHSGGHYDEFGYNVGFTNINDNYTYVVQDAAASIRMGYNGSIEFRTAPAGNAGSALALTNRLIIKENGNVGIGSNADHKLDVKGTIHAQEVLVDLNVPGPDYVFEPTYDLPSLNEVEKFINENKHLPEVPSARQMEEEGLNLKEMNLLLLKKVEELTLYIIELKKENVTQQKQSDEQQAQINKLLSKK
jgi:hypothetical protein